MINDLISRQAAIDMLEERINANGYSNVALSELYDLLEQMPTVDAVKVVHCAECTWSDWYTAIDGNMYCYCLETGQRGLTETDYCSFGEIDKGEQDDGQTN